jgi:hypothetical protein
MVRLILPTGSSPKSVRPSRRPNCLRGDTLVSSLLESHSTSHGASCRLQVGRPLRNLFSPSQPFSAA